MAFRTGASRAWVVVAVLAAACDKGAPTAPVIDAAPSFAKVLDEAGQDVWKLCKLVREHPDAPESKTALDRVRATWEKVAPSIKRNLNEHALDPKLRDPILAVVDGGAAAPCNRSVAVYVDVSTPFSLGEPDSTTKILGEAIERDTGWIDRGALGNAIADALSELGEGWLRGVYDERKFPGESSFPHLVVSLFMQWEEGAVRVGDNPGSVYPGLRLRPSVTMTTPLPDGAPPVWGNVSLEERRFEPKGVLQYTKTQKDGWTDSDFMERLAHTMLEQVGRPQGAIPRLIGLAKPDPAIAPFAGFYTLKQGEIEDGCKKTLALGVPSLRIDAMRAAVVSDGERRIYPAAIENDALVAKTTVDFGNCPGAEDPETWNLTRRDATTLVGTIVGSYHVDPKHCDKPCTYTVHVELTQTTPP